MVRWSKKTELTYRICLRLIVILRRWLLLQLTRYCVLLMRLDWHDVVHSSILQHQINVRHFIGINKQYFGKSKSHKWLSSSQSFEPALYWFLSSYFLVSMAAKLLESCTDVQTWDVQIFRGWMIPPFTQPVIYQKLWRGDMDHCKTTTYSRNILNDANAPQWHSKPVVPLSAEEAQARWSSRSSRCRIHKCHHRSAAAAAAAVVDPLWHVHVQPMLTADEFCSGTSPTADLHRLTWNDVSANLRV